ncbi:MAG: hypothetical protein AAGI38_01095 [Bacteroidota bacterium]
MKLFVFSFICVLLIGCKEKEVVVIQGNMTRDYEGVNDLSLHGYINRCYIDLLGREALPYELDLETDELRKDQLSLAARDRMLQNLQTGSDWVSGDSTYSHAYHFQLYQSLKVRFVEGVGDVAILAKIETYRFNRQKDSLEGRWEQALEFEREMRRLQELANTQHDYRQGKIGISEACARMMNNHFYDQINMNNINFIRAVHDNLFYRYHTQEEFDAAFELLEHGTPARIRGQIAYSKGDYLQLLTGTQEFHEGMIRWAYRMLMSRDPSSQETAELLEDFVANQDFKAVQRSIMKSDEYARF